MNVETLEFAKAEDLLNALTPGTHLWEYRPSAWIFRGLADAEFQLLPSALRQDTPLHFDHTNPRLAVRPTHREQVALENALLQQLSQALDYRAIAVPFDGPHMRYEPVEHRLAPAVEKVMRGELAWPTSDWQALAALAQHYGIPTRLLDWSQQPLPAVYFAARECAEWVVRDRMGKGVHAVPEKLAVWALNGDFILGARRTREESEIVLTGAPGATNPNLAAQAGLFSLHAVKQHENERPIVRPHNEVLEEEARARDDQWFAKKKMPKVIMKKLLLPSSESPKLLRLLTYRGIDCGGIYPGHRGVADALKEELFHDQSDRGPWGG